LSKSTKKGVMESKSGEEDIGRGEIMAGGLMLKYNFYP
jgi:hypothetical protein